MEGTNRVFMISIKNPMTSMKKIIKQFIPPILISILSRKWWSYYKRRSLPDSHLYQPLFSPWAGLPGFKEHYNEIQGLSLISPERCWILYSLAKQCCALPGDFFEIGVYRGGSALLFRRVFESLKPVEKNLRLFDTFEGMPETDAEKDFHKKGEFKNTSLESVQSKVGNAPFIHYHKGFVPDTFAGLEDSCIAFAHVDVDIHRSVVDCCKFLYPRMTFGGCIVFDDYGFPSCPGARQAVDEFFADKPEEPLVLPTGQAVVFKIS
jgi:O-methyltransferase